MTTINLSGAYPKFKRPRLLTHPNIPKPLHGLAPRTMMGTAWWDERREEAYKKNNYCCWACGVSKTAAREKKHLEAHEAYDFDYQQGTARLIEIVALCHYCHNFIHCGRLKNLAEKGEVSWRKFQDVMTHGLAVLETADLEPHWHLKAVMDPEFVPPPQPNGIAPWSAWRLVIDGREFKSLFRSFEEWKAYYGVDTTDD
jgi:hypothetical protein